MVPEGHDDPCQSIPMNPKRKRERFLTDAEFTRLAQVLDEVSGNGSQVSAGAVTTIRLLMLTGCRKSEIMTLPSLSISTGRRSASSTGRPATARSASRRRRRPCSRPCRASREIPGSSRARSRERTGRHRRGLAEHPRAGRSPRRAHPLHPSFLCNNVFFRGDFQRLAAQFTAVIALL